MNTLRRQVAGLGILLLIAGVAHAQQAPTVMVGSVRKLGHIDPELHLGMRSGDGALDNHTQLQKALDAPATNVYPIQFPAKRFNFILPPLVKKTGRAFLGQGLHLASAADNPASVGPTLGTASRLHYAGTMLAFNGTSITGSTSGASATITIQGHTVTANDVGLTLKIGTTATGDAPDVGSGIFDVAPSGGANFIPGHYMVTAVVPNVGATPGTWTVDRVCSTGNGAGLIGQAAGTLWKDAGAGSYYRGLYFAGHHPSVYNANSTGYPRAKVLWHQLPRDYDGNWALSTGKVLMQHCSFAQADVGLLFGLDLREAYEMPGAGLDYVGENYNHGDHFRGDKLEFTGVRTPIYVRNQQSVNHVFTDISITNSCDMFYLERGGKITIDHVSCLGSFGNVLRIGSGGDNSGVYTVRDVMFDGNSGDTAFKVLAMDYPSSSHDLVSFEGGIIPANMGAYSVPIFDANGVKLVVDKWRRLRPGSVKLTKHPSTGTKAYVEITHSIFEGCTLQSDVIDATSDPGLVVEFFGNTGFRPERYITGGHGLTIATGAVAALASHHTVDTEAAAATDDLDTISGGTNGQVLILRAANGARTVVVKDGTGNINCAGDRTLDNASDTITLHSDGTTWYETQFSDNGA